MHYIALLNLLSAVVTLFIGSFVFHRNPKATFNRVFIALSLTVSFWAFTEFQFQISESLTSALFWNRMGFIWPVGIGIFFHFILLLTENSLVFHKRVLLPAIYIPAVAFSILAYTWDAQLARTPWGWEDIRVINFENFTWKSIAYLWAIFMAGLSTYISLSHYRHATTHQMRKMAKHVLIGVLFPVILGTGSEIILPFFIVHSPALTTASCLIMFSFFAYAIWRYDLFALNASTAAESIISTMSDALFLVNADHIIQTVNNAALHILGYERHELIGHPIAKVFASEDDDETTKRTNYYRTISTGVVNDVEVSLQTKSGNKIPVSLSWSETKGKESEIIGTTFIARDITDRIRLKRSLQEGREELENRVEEKTHELKISNNMLRAEIAERMLAEEKLAAEKEYLAVTLRSIGDGVITTDSNGNITLLNNVAEELTGWQLGSAYGKHLGVIFNVYDEETREKADETIGNLVTLSDSTYLGANLLLISKDGTERTISHSGAPIKDKNGQIIGFVLVFQDITDRKKLEEELFKTRKLESIAVLADGIAHDFNNILTGIMTNLFVARMQVQPDSEVFELLSETEKAAFRASSLTKQLLTFSTGSAPMKETHQLDSIIADSAGYCLSESDVDYNITIDETLHEVDVDRGLIDQALSHIIKNAEDASPTGGNITIVARNIEVSKAHSLPIKVGNYVLISITDEGPGIDDDILHKIFDPYFTTKSDANGLGLTTAYSIIRKHDGCIDVSTELNKGTTFTIYLPVSGQVKGESEEGEEEQETKTARKTMKGKGRVLLMDDDIYIRKSTGKLLSHLGYDTAVAVDGNEALQLYKDAKKNKRNFDVVILDLTVDEGMGGQEAMERLKEIDPGATVFISSGYTNHPLMSNFKSAGFYGAILKPYQIEELSETIRRAILERTEKAKSAR